MAENAETEIAAAAMIHHNLKNCDACHLPPDTNREFSFDPRFRPFAIDTELGDSSLALGMLAVASMGSTRGSRGPTGQRMDVFAKFASQYCVYTIWFRTAPMAWRTHGICQRRPTDRRTTTKQRRQSGNSEGGFRYRVGSNIRWMS